VDGVEIKFMFLGSITGCIPNELQTLTVNNVEYNNAYRYVCDFQLFMTCNYLLHEGRANTHG